MYDLSVTVLEIVFVSCSWVVTSVMARTEVHVVGDSLATSRSIMLGFREIGDTRCAVADGCLRPLNIAHDSFVDPPVRHGASVQYLCVFSIGCAGMGCEIGHCRFVQARKISRFESKLF